MVIAALLDASVLIKWIHDERESEVAEARAIFRAHQRRILSIVMLDLTVYELGNVLLRSLHWPAIDIAEQVDDFIQLCGPPLALEPAWRREAAEIGATHGLTYYDAAYAATARRLQIPLITADKLLLASGLAESATEFCQRMRFPVG